MPKRAKPSSAAEAPMRKRRTKEDRARLMEELQATIEVLGEEMEALAPHLLTRWPPLGCRAAPRID